MRCPGEPAHSGVTPHHTCQFATVPEADKPQPDTIPRRLLLVLQEHGLDLDQLMGPGPYKEQYRADMIHWGESRRRQDPSFFCRLASRGACQPVWVGERGSCCCDVILQTAELCSVIGQLVSDARRLSDLQWFQAEFPQQTQSVRVQSSEKTRSQRGWSFTAGEIESSY